MDKDEIAQRMFGLGESQISLYGLAGLAYMAEQDRRKKERQGKAIAVSSGSYQTLERENDTQ